MKTAFFSKAEGPAQVGDAKLFAQRAFSLPLNEISDIEEISDRFYLIQVIEKRPATVPAFETVSDRVLKDWIKDQQDEKARKEAGALLDAMRKGGKSLEEVASGQNLKPASTELFRRNAVIPGLGYEPEINEEAFRLTSAQPIAEKVVKGGSGYYVIELKERKLPADDGFEKEREQIYRQILSQKQNRVYADLGLVIEGTQ